MDDLMTFPDTWEEFEQDYGFTDVEQVYTNGSRLIQSFRVKQWLDHISDETKAETDIISRQAAIDETWKEPSYTDPYNVLTEVRERIQSLPSTQPELLAHGEGELSAQPEPQWIPCSERLPEEKDAGILKKLGTSKRSEYVLATVEVKGERMTVTA